MRDELTGEASQGAVIGQRIKRSYCGKAEGKRKYIKYVFLGEKVKKDPESRYKKHADAQKRAEFGKGSGEVSACGQSPIKCATGEL